MGLTANDLSEIRDLFRNEIKTTVRDEVRSAMRAELKSIEERLDRIESKLTAIESDVKELYRMVSELHKSSITDKSFQKQTLEQKLLKLNNELLTAAKQAGITLPR